MAKEKKEQKPAGKSKQEKFVELAEVRVSKTLKQIATVGNLSDKAKYEYTEKEIKQIYDALKGSLDRMKARFENGEQKEEVFKLS